jgi:hypothetical protein
MFGFLRRRKDNELLEETIEIIGKTLILEGFNSENATKIAIVSIDIISKNIGEIDGHRVLPRLHGHFKKAS